MAINHYPKGFPYVLFVNSYKGNSRFFLASNPASAWQKANQKGHIDTVKPGDLLTTFGHKSTREFLENFGDEWVSCDGIIFYKEQLNTVVMEK